MTGGEGRFNSRIDRDEIAGDLESQGSRGFHRNRNQSRTERERERETSKPTVSPRLLRNWSSTEPNAQLRTYSPILSGSTASHPFSHANITRSAIILLTATLSDLTHFSLGHCANRFPRSNVENFRESGRFGSYVPPEK